MRISNQDFIKQIAKTTGYAQTNIKEVIQALSNELITNLQNGNEVVVCNGLTVGVKDVKEANRRNPKTGEEIVCPAHKAPKAKFGTAIKNAIK